MIEDLNSTNGIMISGKRTRRHVLIDGDIVEIGTHRLRYVEERPNNAHNHAETSPGMQATAVFDERN